MLLLFLALVDCPVLPDGPYPTTWVDTARAPVSPLVLTRIRGPHYVVRGYDRDPGKSSAEGRATWLPLGLLDVTYVGAVEPYGPEARFHVRAVMVYVPRRRSFEVLRFDYYEIARGPAP